jgi:hypothetical protein
MFPDAYAPKLSLQGFWIVQHGASHVIEATVLDVKELANFIQFLVRTKRNQDPAEMAEFFKKYGLGDSPEKDQWQIITTKLYEEISPKYDALLTIMEKQEDISEQEISNRNEELKNLISRTIEILSEKSYIPNNTTISLINFFNLCNIHGKNQFETSFTDQYGQHHLRSFKASALCLFARCLLQRFKYDDPIHIKNFSQIYGPNDTVGNFDQIMLNLHNELKLPDYTCGRRFFQTEFSKLSKFEKKKTKIADGICIFLQEICSYFEKIKYFPKALRTELFLLNTSTLTKEPSIHFPRKRQELHEKIFKLVAMNYELEQKISGIESQNNRKQLELERTISELKHKASQDGGKIQSLKKYIIQNVHKDLSELVICTIEELNFLSVTGEQLIKSLRGDSIIWGKDYVIWKEKNTSLKTEFINNVEEDLRCDQLVFSTSLYKEKQELYVNIVEKQDTAYIVHQATFQYGSIPFINVRELNLAIPLNKMGESFYTKHNNIAYTISPDSVLSSGAKITIEGLKNPEFFGYFLKLSESCLSITIKYPDKDLDVIANYKVKADNAVLSADKVETDNEPLLFNQEIGKFDVPNFIE